MKVLLTGAAGFIGSHLAESLLADGHTVVGIDNMDSFYSRNIKDKNLAQAKSSGKFIFLERDINDAALFNESELADVGVIIHLAAKAGVRPSIEKPDAYMVANANGSMNLLMFAQRQGVRRFIFASSSSVYGKNPQSPWSEDHTELMPISPYAASKIATEFMGKVYAHLYDLQFVALRFFTVYGPRQRPDLAIHKFFKKIYAGEEIDLYGNGQTFRDYTYISDIIAGINAVIHSEKVDKGFNCYNLGNCYEVSLADLVKQIQDITGIRARIRYLPEQPGDVHLTCADINKSARELGYKPMVKIGDGLRMFNEWYKNEILL